MSSPYQVLGNRSIDQWKVTELKEELKRRKLTTKGLKEDLIKRLDEALRNERENAEEDVDNGFDCPSSPEAVDKDVVTEPDNEDVVISDDRDKKVDDAAVQVDISEGAAALIQRENPEEITAESNIMVDKKQDICAISVETSTMVSENVVSEMAESVQEEQNNETQKESGAAKPQKEEDSKSTHDLLLKSSNSNNQVSEVNPVLGFRVKSDSISTDSVSINEKNELKDNIIADNVKLDLDVIKPEMVEPSSSSVVPDGGELHPMDVEEPHEKKVPVEETDNNHSTDADLNKKNDSADMGSSEKLNLDRSSGDDSMEDDILESKQIDSKYNSNEVGNRSKQTEVPLVREEIHANIVGDVPSADTKEVHVEPKNKPVPPPEKRKLQDAAGGNIESSKRQRRWNAESLKIPEPQSSNLSPSTTPKDAFQATTLKRNFSRSDSTVSEDAPKERVVPPSPKPPTNSLRIDRFLRPFTLKAVQELLGKTGSVTSFWMDHIKTHCYVSYASVEEAMETRNAVYNLQWPPNGGRLLVAEFVDPQEVKTRAEAPQAPAAAAPVSVRPAVPPPPPPAKQPQPSPRKQQVSLRQQLPPPPPLPLPPPPPLSNLPQTRERLPLPLPLPLPPPPPLPEKADLPIVTLDDLFQKTKATPRIYYLPLSEEQVAAKLKAQGKNTK